jgi:hypothetical protein
MVQHSKHLSCQHIKLLLMRLVLFCVTILAAFAACKKDKLDVNLFWNCNQSQHLDTTAISVKLMSSWTWSKQACFGTGNTVAANKNIKVTFRTDHTFSVNENATLLTQGTWKLVQLDSNSCRLDLSSASEYLYGRILFCDDQVLFNDSYRDGCDNLFIK